MTEQQWPRFVCACGTPIPSARAGRERCSTECDDLEAARQRAEMWQEVMREAAAALDEWVRQGMLHGRRDWR